MDKTAINTIWGTIISGVVVYILCQLYTEFILRPIQEYKKIKAKIAKSIIYNAQYYSNPLNIYEKTDMNCKWSAAADETRILAVELSAFSEIMPWRILCLFSIPSRKKMVEASECLIGLSNLFFGDGDDRKFAKDLVKTICKNLGIKSKK